MNLKNYTSGVPVYLTVARIEQLLAEAGANSVTKEYGCHAEMVALRFTVLRPDGKPLTIRLPADPDAVFEVMKSEVQRPRAGTMDRLKEQALRTSWKLMQDWTEVQLSLIRLQKVDLLQVFLPYVFDGKQTFYQALKAKNFLALPQ